MRLQDAINNIYVNYSQYGIDKAEIRRLIIDGIQNYGLSVKACYNGLRMSLGQQYSQQEIFTVDEVAEMLEIDKQEALKLMQQCGIKPIKSVQKSITFLYKPDKGERGKQ